jgi:4-hydroxy 2-oxovalerate aldolase
MHNHKKMKDFKLLDCTLRDGGYYNNWDFDQETVEIYLNALVAASIDIVEIGFRSLPKKSFKGPYIYSQDEYIESLSIPDELEIAIMINSKDFLRGNDSPTSLINKLFQPAKLSPVDLVRIAVNFDDAIDVEIISGQLKDLGYKVAINLMQAHGKSHKQYRYTSGRIAAWETVDILYFADSLGCMNPTDVSFICEAIRAVWREPLGIHAHNNKGMALINSLTAIEAGANWCDSTVMGMGRGAGNVNTEALLMECSSRGLHSGNARHLTICSERFDNLRQKYKWGPNPYYHYAANNCIHPTYVQAVLNNVRYKPDQIDNILESLAQNKSSSFNERVLKNAVNHVEVHSSKGDWDATDWLKGRKVLMIGAGPSVLKYRNAIISYIKRNKPAVIFLNINDYIPSELGDATIVAHKGFVQCGTEVFITTSMTNAWSGQYSLLEHPIIMPYGRLRTELGAETKNINILDYGLDVQEGAFHIGASGCVLQWPLGFAYGLSVVTQAGATDIQMVGFDGYSSSDPRQDEMNEVIATYSELQNCLPLKSLTPTNYQISQGSIFEPQIQTNDYVVIIPARYQSTRFPGKPLADMCGKSLIRRVWDKCVEAVAAENVLVATDDERIQAHCVEQGIQVVMTSSKCLTGTDRVCEVAHQVERDIYINVQGDEPLIDPKDILIVLESARRHKSSIINGMCPIKKEQDFRSPNVPKVISAEDGRLLYMSRAPIPTGKNYEFGKASRQVCIYSFPRKAILEYGRRKQKSSIEEIEDIEILRFLEMGHSVRMVNVSGSELAVDTKEDLQRAINILNNESPNLSKSLVHLNS